ncbi:hypothetical protein C8T65DRAFT_131676 [Cerioporus squamosus]|nr:hypothetical protein C8T65DRAFT_131676 [Cerioporus squamosus]
MRTTLTDTISNERNICTRWVATHQHILDRTWPCVHPESLILTVSPPLPAQAEPHHLHHLWEDVSQCLQPHTRITVQRTLPPISYIWYLRAIACRPYNPPPKRMHMATGREMNLQVLGIPGA